MYLYNSIDCLDFIKKEFDWRPYNNLKDIKGANVLVDNDGVCKLADFGSAKKICGIYEDERFQSLSGTAYWMAPEVIKQKGYGRYK